MKTKKVPWDKPCTGIDDFIKRQIGKKLSEIMDAAKASILEDVNDSFNVTAKPYVQFTSKRDGQGLYISLGESDSCTAYVSWQQFTEWTLDSDEEELEHWIPMLEQLAAQMKSKLSELKSEE